MTAHLIRDDRRWQMPSLTAVPSVRRLRVWQLDDGTLLVFITERGENTSVTNVAEHAYAKVQREHPGARVFEHYPSKIGASLDEHVDEITLTDRGTPHWSRWPAAVIADWIGPDALVEEAFA